MESQEAKIDVCHTSLSVACVCELSDSAWHDPCSVVACVYELSDSAWHDPCSVVACVYELSDPAWHDPCAVVKGQQEGQLSASRKPGQHLTNNCEACTQDKMLTNFQVTTRANSVGALPAMLGLVRVASSCR